MRLQDRIRPEMDRISFMFHFHKESNYNFLSKDVWEAVNRIRYWFELLCEKDRTYAEYGLKAKYKMTKKEINELYKFWDMNLTTI
jgi:hypothetical protein